MAPPLGAGEGLGGWAGEAEPPGGLTAASLAGGAAWPEERSGAAAGGLDMPRAGLGGRTGAAVPLLAMSGPCMGLGGLLGVTW